MGGLSFNHIVVTTYRKKPNRFLNKFRTFPEKTYENEKTYGLHRMTLVMEQDINLRSKYIRLFGTVAVMANTYCIS